MSAEPAQVSADGDFERLVAVAAAEQVALDGTGGVTGLWAEWTGAFLPPLIDMCAELRRLSAITARGS